MLRVALIGCGKIADLHVLAIRRVRDCEIVAVCDREPLMAEQLAERFRIPQCATDTATMLREAKPDVVHITTPPQGHYALARQCLEAGANVYVEKPFTVTAEEAESLIALAEDRGLRLTAGHNLQFTLEMLALRRLIAEGFIGGKAVHVESHFSYSLADASYVGPLLSNRAHWVRQLPGQLFHNLLSHGIARLAAFLDDDLREVTASAHQSAELRRLGGEEILDELRVLIRDGGGTTAFFCFSTQMAPGLNQLRVCGPRNSITVDQVSGSVLRHVNRSYKSYLIYFTPPFVFAADHLRNGFRNIWNFLTQRLHQDAGVKELTEQFYDSIRRQTEPPLPYREILLTARIMDRIFAQVYPATAAALPQTNAA